MRHNVYCLGEGAQRPPRSLIVPIMPARAQACVPDPSCASRVAARMGAPASVRGRSHPLGR
eukprot:3252110-Pleurochrysis_carterae.AAC.1